MPRSSRSTVSVILLMVVSFFAGVMTERVYLHIRHLQRAAVSYSLHRSEPEVAIRNLPKGQPMERISPLPSLKPERSR